MSPSQDQPPRAARDPAPTADPESIESRAAAVSASLGYVHCVSGVTGKVREYRNGKPDGASAPVPGADGSGMPADPVGTVGAEPTDEGPDVGRIPIVTDAGIVLPTPWEFNRNDPCWWAIWAEEAGFLVTLIKPGKKRPFDKDWGLNRKTRLAIEAFFRRNKGGGAGICLGPGQGPCGIWIIDIEGDGPEAEESRIKLFGGEIVETFGWRSERGAHLIFALRHDSPLAELLKRAGATTVEGPGKGAGTFKLDEYPGLEWRIGGLKADGVVKQFQSVIPSIKGREFNGCWTIAWFPKAALAALDTIGERVAIRGGASPHANGQANSSPKMKSDGKIKARITTRDDALAAYVAKALADECDAVKNEPMGNRNARLNLAAFNLGQFVGAKALMRTEVEKPLLDAALNSGLEHSESVATIRSGLDAGITQPRDLSHVANGVHRNDDGNGSGAHRRDDADEEDDADEGRPSSGFLLGKNRKPISCLTNTIKLLRMIEGVGPIRYDSFRREILVGDDQQPMSDQVIIALTAKVELAVKTAWSQDHVKSALIHISDEHKFSSLTEWLDSLGWDGVRRIEGFFAEHYGTTHSLYAAEVARTFFVGAVARAYEPGCKLDTVPLLMGNQGIGKSRGMADLCPDPEWFCDELGGDLGSKAAAEGLAGKWIIELAELDAMRRSELETVKSFITRQSDRYRIPYAKTASDFPRTVAFFGTTNSRTPLEDIENRRFLPIPVQAPDGQKTIDFAAIKADRDQLWAEAVKRFKDGEEWWTTSPHVWVPMSEHAEHARRVDAWEEILEERMEGLAEITTQGAASLLGISPDKLDKSSQIRIGICLAKLGWIRGEKPKGPKPRVYTRPHVGGP